VRSENGIDLGKSDFDFAELDVEIFYGAFVAACYEFAAGDSPVGREPLQHDPGVEELADGGEVLRRETPVNDYWALDLVQGFDEKCCRCARLEHGVPGWRQAVAIKHPGFL
jgi:hypothetical protein